MLWTCREVPGITTDILTQLTVYRPLGLVGRHRYLDQRIIVVYNDKKSDGRQSSDITHELAHVILDHEPAKVILSETIAVTMRSFDQKQEDEANCLAWALLLPRQALVTARMRRMTPERMAAAFGVTETLVKYRLNTTGIDVQLRRSRSRGA